MKFLKSLLLCFFFFGLGNFKAQENKNEELGYIYIFNYKYAFLLKEKFNTKRMELNFNEKLKSKLLDLKKIYEQKGNSDLIKSLKKYKSPPKELFKEEVYLNYLKLYPDINAVFFNRGNLLTDEKISDEEKQKYNEVFLEIAKQIPNDIYIEVSKITDEINKDKFALTVPNRFEIFQDLFDENQRKRIDIINFLLWNLQ